uniref:Uncharacterized protein n=1 Tax=Anguilla anguilla TaxID=7936 RepID=A0A0E9U479_ANGAN
MKNSQRLAVADLLGTGTVLQRSVCAMYNRHIRYKY